MMLQVCLACILGNGSDAMHVLGHLADTISSMHIPTGASAMHAVELMLSHLDVPPNMPALLGFVNDMLMSMCTPKS